MLLLKHSVSLLDVLNVFHSTGAPPPQFQALRAKLCRAINILTYRIFEGAPGPTEPDQKRGERGEADLRIIVDKLLNILFTSEWHLSCANVSWLKPKSLQESVATVKGPSAFQNLLNSIVTLAMLDFYLASPGTHNSFCASLPLLKRWLVLGFVTAATDKADGAPSNFLGALKNCLALSSVPTILLLPKLDLILTALDSMVHNVNILKDALPLNGPLESLQGSIRAFLHSVSRVNHQIFLINSGGTEAAKMRVGIQRHLHLAVLRELIHFLARERVADGVDKLFRLGTSILNSPPAGPGDQIRGCCRDLEGQQVGLQLLLRTFHVFVSDTTSKPASRIASLQSFLVREEGKFEVLGKAGLSRLGSCICEGMKAACKRLAGDQGEGDLAVVSKAAIKTCKRIHDQLLKPAATKGVVRPSELYVTVGFYNHPWFPSGAYGSQAQANGDQQGIRGTWLVYKLAPAEEVEGATSLAQASFTKFLEFINRISREVPGTVVFLPQDVWHIEETVKLPTIRVRQPIFKLEHSAMHVLFI